MMPSPDFEIRRQIDEICNHFEAKWTVGVHPAFNSFLNSIDVEYRDALLGELLKTDIELRRKAGEVVRLEDYHELGAEAINVVESILARSPALSPNDQEQTRFHSPNHAIQSPSQLPEASPEEIRTSSPLTQRLESETSGSVSSIETTGEFRIELPGQLKIGTEFGRYKILEELGGGGMGNVYKARDQLLGRHVAIKIPHLSGHSDSTRGEIVERFHREARSMASLNHPNLCQIHDVGCHNGLNFLSMAFIEGQSLKQFLLNNRQVSLSLAFRLSYQIALALDQAHDQAVIHRDLKPANIMLTNEKEPIVIDFGLARIQTQVDSPLNTSPGRIVGTPAYMSPEQVRGENDQLTPASDVFSLGVITYQLITGTLPFSGRGMEIFSSILTADPEKPSSLRRDLNNDIDDLILKAIQKPADERFQSMQEFALAIEKVIDTSTDRSTPRRKKRRTFNNDLDHDIYVVYSPMDDVALFQKSKGWVTSFVQDLEWRLCQLNGNTEEVSVFVTSDPIHDASLEMPHFLNSKMLLIINSPGFVNSIWSLDELKALKASANSKASNGEVCIVETAPSLTSTQLVEAQPNAMNFRFWQSAGEGFSLFCPDSSDKAMYFEKVDDVARRIIQSLRGESIKREFAEDLNEVFGVYLAEVTDDLDPVREEVRRYLEQAGVEVYPKFGFPRDRTSFTESVNHDLSHSKLYIQLLSQVVGKRVPNSSKNYAGLQYECSKSFDIQKLVWRSPEIEASTLTDADHRELLFGPDVLAMALQEFKRLAALKIENLRKSSWKSRSTPSDSFIFLNVDKCDSPDAQEVRAVLDELGVCYALPIGAGPPSEIGEDLEANMIDCDAYVIYYGKSSEKWVREQLRMWRRILHRRNKPVQALAIFEGPPNEKSPIGMSLPNMELLNCRDGIDREVVKRFLSRLGASRDQ